MERVEKNFGQVVKCRGEKCGADIIFVEYYSMKNNQNQKTCVNAKPVLVLLPIFEKDEAGHINFKKPPIKWAMRQAFTPHHATCPDVEKFRRV